LHIAHWEMKKLVLITLTVFVLLPNFADAQRWKRYRRQVIGGVGVTNFLGELGGANKIGRDGFVDLDFAATRPTLLVGYRYQINGFFFLRGNLSWGILRGDDRFTKEQYRQGRNLHFRSGFFDVNAMAEFYLFQNARGNLYRLRGVRGKKGLNLDLYIFGGIGFMYFNPKAEIDGQWVALQPLRTEGQGLPGQPEQYNRTTFNIPYGIGIGKSIDRYTQVNMELTLRMTFTDYIDDVSTDYYGRANLERDLVSEFGFSPEDANRAARLSDRNIYSQVAPETGIVSNQDLGKSTISQQRGDSSDNDSFMTLVFSVARKIVKRRRSRPKF